jgi:hypothetical protein
MPDTTDDSGCSGVAFAAAMVEGVPSRSGEAAEPTPSDDRARGDWVLRAICHLVAVTPVVVVGVMELARGWRPTSDDAAVAWRTYAVFSSHLPLVGQFTSATASSAHPAFDLGPLQYYLLAVPDRIDPVQGVLWGSILLAAALVVLAVEAAWSAGRPVAPICVAASVAVLCATQGGTVLNLVWNPSIGVFAFTSTIVISAAAATGRLGWWPVAAFTASLAAQCHLVYAVAAFACLLVGLSVGLVARHRAGVGARRSWPTVGVGLGVVVVCSVAPAIQQLTGRPGNLSVLAHSVRSHGGTLGIGFALRGVSSVTGPLPAWLRTPPSVATPASYFHFLSTVFGGSAIFGGLALTLAAVVAVAALVTARHGLAGLAGCAALGGVAVAWALSSVAGAQASAVSYLDVALWPVGMGLDATAVWALYELVMVVAGQLARSSVDPARGSSHHRRAAAVGTTGVAVACCGLLGLLAWSLGNLVPAVPRDSSVIGGWAMTRAVPGLAAQIARVRPRGPFLVEPSVNLLPGGLRVWSATEATAYALRTEGFDAKLPHVMAREFGAGSSAPTTSRTFVVEQTPSGGFTVVEVKHPLKVSVLAYLRRSVTSRGAKLAAASGARTR